METTITQAPAAAPETAPAQPTAPDSKNKPAPAKDGKAQAEKPAGPAPEKALDTPDNREKLRLILRREKEDPNVRFTDAELDLYDAYTAGKIQPAKRTKPQSPKAEETPISAPKEEKPEGEEAETPEKPEGEDGEGDEADPDPDDDEGSQPDPDAEALMKEVGAKSLKEAAQKVKELRSKLGGADAQAVATLRKQVSNEQALWQDVAKGVPAAIAHAERVYGIKVGPANAGAGAAPASPAPAASSGQKGGRQYIDENLFIDPESAKIANDVLRSRDAELDELRGQLKEVFEERDRGRRDNAVNTARMAVVDEMVTVAQRIDALKAVPNLREAIAQWYDKGTPDPRMEVFNELFQIAEKEGCNLLAAATIKRGLDADRLVAEAEERGRKAAYGHKPNPSLSGSQGGRNEQGNYTQLTDAQIEAMVDDHRLIPPDWFDDKDNLVKAKIPKRAWAAFGFA